MGAVKVAALAGTIVWADPSLRYTSLLLGRWATNQQTNKHALDRIAPASFSCLIGGRYHTI